MSPCKFQFGQQLYIMAIIIQFIHIVKLLYTYVQQINYTRGEVTLTEFSQTFFCADIADVRQKSIGHSGLCPTHSNGQPADILADVRWTFWRTSDGHSGGCPTDILRTSDGHSGGRPMDILRTSA